MEKGGGGREKIKGPKKDLKLPSKQDGQIVRVIKRGDNSGRF